MNAGSHDRMLDRQHRELVVALADLARQAIVAGADGGSLTLTLEAASLLYQLGKSHVAENIRLRLDIPVGMEVIVTIGTEADCAGRRPHLHMKLDERDVATTRD